MSDHAVHYREHDPPEPPGGLYPPASASHHRRAPPTAEQYTLQVPPPVQPSVQREYRPVMAEHACST